MTNEELNTALYKKVFAEQECIPPLRNKLSLARLKLLKHLR